MTTRRDFGVCMRRLDVKCVSLCADSASDAAAEGLGQHLALTTAAEAVVAPGDPEAVVVEVVEPATELGRVGALAAHELPEDRRSAQRPAEPHADEPDDAVEDHALTVFPDRAARP